MSIEQEKEFSRYICGITTYTIDNYTKDDDKVKVGYAVTISGISTNLYNDIKIPKLESGEIDTYRFYRNLKGQLLKLNMVTTSVTIEEFIPGDRYNAGTIQQRQVDVELIEKDEDSE